MNISLIAAVARNQVIGMARRIPWDLPEDRAYFKEKTLGNILVMGRHTFLSIGRPLPGRRTLVLTRRKDWKNHGIETAASLGELFSMLKGVEEEIFIAGGSGVYRDFLPLAQNLYLTWVEAEPRGDRFFPPVPWEEWKEVSRRPRVDAVSGLHYSFCVYIRENPPGEPNL